MKTTVAVLIGAGFMLLGVPRASHAQTTGVTSGPFADVPAEHWAYQAVDTLQKAGIIVGYPDATYGGKRALSRYEFSVALARLLTQSGFGKATDSQSLATKEDLNALRDDLSVKTQANTQAVNDLQRSVSGLQPERQQLSQTEAATKARLDALEQRRGRSRGKH